MVWAEGQFTLRRQPHGWPGTRETLLVRGYLSLPMLGVTESVDMRLSAVGVFYLALACLEYEA